MTTITVTREHIGRGAPGSCTDCPVALAIEDAFPGIIGAIVGSKYITIHGAGQDALLRIPDDVLDAIRAIDREEPVEPFSFELDYPAEATA